MKHMIMRLSGDYFYSCGSKLPLSYDVDEYQDCPVVREGINCTSPIEYAYYSSKKLSVHFVEMMTTVQPRRKEHARRKLQVDKYLGCHLCDDVRVLCGYQLPSRETSRRCGRRKSQPKALCF